MTKLYGKSKHILCSIIFFFFENRAVYEIIWKNIAQPDRLQVKHNVAHALCVLDT